MGVGLGLGGFGNARNVELLKRNDSDKDYVLSDSTTPQHKNPHLEKDKSKEQLPAHL